MLCICLYYVYTTIEKLAMMWLKGRCIAICAPMKKKIHKLHGTQMHTWGKRDWMTIWNGHVHSRIDARVWYWRKISKSEIGRYSFLFELYNVPSSLWHNNQVSKCIKNTLVDLAWFDFLGWSILKEFHTDKSMLLLIWINATDSSEIVILVTFVIHSKKYTDEIEIFATFIGLKTLFDYANIHHTYTLLFGFLWNLFS